MNRFARLTQLAGLTSVPVIGVALGGWTNKTALVLYWCETLMLIVLVGLRILIHRLVTKKRGHYVEVLVKTTSHGTSSSRRKIGHFGTSFVVLALAFWLFSGGLLGVLMKGDPVGVGQLKQALPVTAALMVAGLVLDLWGIGHRPFAWIRRMSEGVLWRVFLVLIVAIAGITAAENYGIPRSALALFAILKFYTDAASQLPEYDPDRPPQWADRLFGRGFADDWSKAKKEDVERRAAEEQLFLGQPMPIQQTLIRRTDG